jgi:hypothetical protein
MSYTYKIVCVLKCMLPTGFILKMNTASKLGPTHIRTEGRSPLRGSEFTTKAVTSQGSSAELAARLKSYFCDMLVVVPPSPPPVRFSNI